MRMLSIDLGKTGAWAMFTDNALDCVADLATDNAGRLDPDPIFELAVEADQIVVEKLHAMPLGSAANFSQGRMTGAIHAIAALVHCPLLEVRPQAWKKGLGFTASGSREQKLEAREMAGRLYPEFISEFSRVKDHDRADAVLIGHYLLTVTP